MKTKVQMQIKAKCAWVHLILMMTFYMSRSGAGISETTESFLMCGFTSIFIFKSPNFCNIKLSVVTLSHCEKKYKTTDGFILNKNVYKVQINTMQKLKSSSRYVVQRF